MNTETLSVLAVDDECTAREALVRLLSADPRVRTVHPARDAVEALRLVRDHAVDAVYVGVAASDQDGPDDPGERRGPDAPDDLGGLELGSLLARLNAPPALVYVSASDRHARAAYDVGAVDYLVKPVRPDRLATSLGRISTWRTTKQGDGLATVPVETGGRTVLVRRDEVLYVEAQGDYVRLHTIAGEHLLRMPMSRLAQRWGHEGFVRVHRGFLVPIRQIRELREDPRGGALVRVTLGAGKSRDLPVSRRLLRPLRERLTDGLRARRAP